MRYIFSFLKKIFKHSSDGYMLNLLNRNKVSVLWHQYRSDTDTNTNIDTGIDPTPVPAEFMIIQTEITIRGRLDSTKTRSSSNVHWRHFTA